MSDTAGEQVALALTEAEQDALACNCLADGICPLHNEASDGYVEHQVGDLFEAVGRIVAERVAQARRSAAMAIKASLFRDDKPDGADQ